MPVSETLGLPVDAVREALNSDPEWTIAGRYWNARIRFYTETEDYFLRVIDGRVESFRHGTDGYQASTIQIGGPRATWQEMLAPHPKPLFNCFYPAMVHNGLALGGDLVSLYAYYGALARLLVVMRREIGKH